MHLKLEFMDSVLFFSCKAQIRIDGGISSRPSSSKNCTRSFEPFLSLELELETANDAYLSLPF